MRNSGYTLKEILNSPLKDAKQAYDCILASKLSETDEGRKELNKSTSKVKPPTFLELTKMFRKIDEKE